MCILRRYAENFLRDLPDGTSLNFSAFVRALSGGLTARSRLGQAEQHHDGPSHLLHPATNPHWRPQRFMCGLEEYLPHCQYVGRFEHLHEDTHELLAHLGLWQEYGSSGWPRVGEMFGAADRGSDANPATDTKTLYPRYFTPELEALARRAYAEDYRWLERVQWGLKTPGVPVT
jgi:hypothetical protein